jgi:hypothetical protein
MNKILTIGVFVFGTFIFSTQYSYAQQVQTAGDVGISMGLLPVYEITHGSGCPQVQAAPSIQWFEYYYRQCNSDQYTRYKKLTDTTEHRLNQKLRDLCMRNEVAGNGCIVELRVEDQHDYSHPIINNINEDEF